jgi:hypothetical protein
LGHLINCEDYKKSYVVLIDDIYHTKLKEEKGSNLENMDLEGLFDTLIYRKDRNSKSIEKLKEALCYLEEERFIKLLSDNYVRITFKGIIQYSKSFVKVYKFDRHKSILDVYNVYISIGLTMVGLLVGYYLGK